MSESRTISWRFSRWMRRGAIWLSLLLVLLLALPEELWARRGGRISVGRSGGGFATRTYRPPPSRAQTWGGRAPATVAPRMGTRTATRPVGGATGRSGVDQATLNRARTQGTVFGSRADAERAFQRDFGNQYPTTFSSQPRTRPSYIPEATSVGGNRYPVTYNQQYGGYGFMRNGSWVAYNTFRDVALLSLLLRQNGYVYSQGREGSDEGAAAGIEGEVAQGRRSSGFGTGSGLLILLMLVGMGAMIPRRQRAYHPQQNRYGKSRPPGSGGKVLARMPDARSANSSDGAEKHVHSDLSPYSARFWRNLKIGSTVILKDEQTLQDMIASGESLASGRDYQLEEAWRIRESRDVAEWQFLRIRSPRDEDATWLLIKSAGDKMSAGVYFEADGFDPATRAELLQQNHLWIFNEPRDPSSYTALDLQYASHLYFNLELNGEVREVEFTKLGNREFHGNASVDPSQRDSERMLGSVAEYETMLAVPNPRVVFFEAGLPGADGGLVRMLQGADIPVGDIEVLPLA